MKIKSRSIVYKNGCHGKYAIAPNVVDQNELQCWIEDQNFSEFINEDNKLDRHSRKRNKLYSFKHPILKNNVIMKVSTIDKQYKFSRRINLLLSTQFSDYNFRAFNGAYLLHKQNISCPKPLAYWNEKNYFWINKSYYLYEKIEAQHSLHSFTESLKNSENLDPDKIIKTLAMKMLAIIKNIHLAGYRQGDPHPGNFLISDLNKNISNTTHEDINNAKLIIIDLDKFEIAKIKILLVKRFFDIRCLRRCTLSDYTQQDMLQMYLGQDHSLIWDKALSFWRRGGFNLIKWFRPDNN